MSDQIDRTVLPIRRPAFSGVANRTLDGSQPDWGLIDHVKPPAASPNVLLVLIDDAGFGNPSTFGGPIDTPNYDRMAAQGLRYSSNTPTHSSGYSNTGRNPPANCPRETYACR
jgi:Sulfatase